MSCEAQLQAVQAAEIVLVQAAANLSSAQTAYNQAMTTYQQAQQALIQCLLGQLNNPGGQYPGPTSTSGPSGKRKRGRP